MRCFVNNGGIHAETEIEGCENTGSYKAHKRLRRPTDCC